MRASSGKLAAFYFRWCNWKSFSFNINFSASCPGSQAIKKGRAKFSFLKESSKAKEMLGLCLLFFCCVVYACVCVSLLWVCLLADWVAFGGVVGWQLTCLCPHVTCYNHPNPLHPQPQFSGNSSAHSRLKCLVCCCRDDTCLVTQRISNLDRTGNELKWPTRCCWILARRRMPCSWSAKCSGQIASGIKGFLLYCALVYEILIWATEAPSCI